MCCSAGDSPRTADGGTVSGSADCVVCCLSCLLPWQPVDVPVPRGRGCRLPGFLPGQGTGAPRTLSRSPTLKFRVVEILVVSVHARRSGLPCSSLTFLFLVLVEVFTVFSQVRCSVLGHRTAHSHDFRIFLPAQGSHESRGAHHHADQGLLSGEHHDYGRLHGAEEEEETDDEHVLGSIEWVQPRDGNAGKPYHWNTRTCATVWKPPPGVKVVWVGTEGSEGGEILLAREDACQHVRPPSSASSVRRSGVRGLASPHPFLCAAAGAPCTWQSRSVSLCCLRCILWFCSGCCTYVSLRGFWFGPVSAVPVVVNDRCVWVQTEQTVWRFRRTVLADMYVAVDTQRQVGPSREQWKCLRFSSSRRFLDNSRFAAETGLHSANCAGCAWLLLVAGVVAWMSVFASFLRHFSHSVQLDVSVGWRGRREFTPGCSATLISCAHAVISPETSL